MGLVFNGHAHQYERNLPQIAGSPLVSYVTGGGGDALGSLSGCSAYDAYAIGSSSSCHAPLPTSGAQVFHYLLVSVNGNQVTVTPTDETGRTFDVQTYSFGPSVPGAPTNVVATAGNGQAQVSWTAPANNGGSAITGYTVTSTPGNITATVGNLTTATVTGLTNGTSYTFTVHATNVAGNGPESAPSNAVTPAGLPGAPTNVTALAGDSAATVSWTAPSSDGGSPITAYTATASPGGATCATGGTLGCTVSGLTNGTTYTFTVTATNGVGTGPASAPSNAVTPAGLPGAPTGVTATAGNGQAQVSWTAPASNGGSTITGYTITGTPGGSASVAGNLTTATVTGLTNGTSYTFTVHASNVAGNGPESAPSNAVTAAPTSCLPGQWLAQYYPNISLSGTPSGVRCEASINNDWGGGGPSGVGVGVDNFSVRWTQTLTVSTAGPYAFTTTSDDGIRVSVDGAYVINDWTDHAPTTDLASAALGVGDHPIVVEYYEHGGGAVAVFSATAAPTSCLPGQWLAQYYPNISLSGTPSGVRCEASINNDWGGGGPSGVGVGVDNFSVRWTQTLTVSTAGPYAFTTTSDDGIRVSVDGAYVINDWTDHAPTTDLASAALGVGDHPIVVEYYEHGGGAVAVFSYSAGP